MEISTRRPRRGRLRRLLLQVSLLGTLALALALLGPSALGLHRYAVTGGSAAGVYDAGSVVFTHDVRTEDLRVGDVVARVARSGAGADALVTRRIVTIHPAGAIDTRAGAAGPVSPWTFRGGSATQPKVAFGLPHVGWVLVVLAEPAVRLVLGVLSLLALLVRLRTTRARRRLGEPTAPSAPVEADRRRVPAGV